MKTNNTFLLLKCKVIKTNLKTDEISKDIVKYEDIFSKDVQKQKEVTALYMNLFRLRDSLLENENSQMAPSPTRVELRMSEYLLPCIDYSSFGKYTYIYISNILVIILYYQFCTQANLDT